MKIVGIDFSSAPTARKPIMIAVGRYVSELESTRYESALEAATWRVATVQIESLLRLPTLVAFEQWLRTPDTWVAGFDFPFGLPRAFLQAQGWGVRGDPWATQPTWSEITAHVAALSRAELVARCRSWTAPRMPGDKFAHRATDRPAGSSPSMKWVNPPVALMLHAGAPRLLAADVTMPGLRTGDAARVALEAYPGMLARQAVGRSSYKSDDRRKQDAARLRAREAIVASLESGRHSLALPVQFDAGLREACLADPSGDTLDAVLCVVQAAWGWQRRDTGYGLPEQLDPLEGWIVGAGNNCVLEH